MKVFRIHIRPHGGEADPETSFKYCLDHGVLGVGWRTNSARSTKDWDAYLADAEQIHDDLQICSYIHREVGVGDLVWTRGIDAQYYLARVTAPWEYWVTPEAVENDIDVANVFRADIRPVPSDAVPGKVIASFRASRTIQRVWGDAIEEYTKHLWNTIVGDTVYALDDAVRSDIFAMLDHEETEDVVALYLQSQGWYLVPNSRKADTMSFEYMLVDPETNERAWTQVKTGDSGLNRDEYAKYPHRVILFQANERYSGRESDNVVCLSRNELVGFLESARPWLPTKLQHRLDMAAL